MVMFTEGSSKKLYTSPNILRDDIIGETINNDEKVEKCMESSLGKLKETGSSGTQTQIHGWIIRYLGKCGANLLGSGEGSEAVSCKHGNVSRIPLFQKTIKFANSSPCASRGSSGQKPQYGLITI
jgi:hypothetical protein